MDTLICKGFEYDCLLGFHEHEQGVKQRISLDVEVTLPAELPQSDDPQNITFDYFKANQLMTEFFDEKKFNLIETVGQGVAELLLKNFAVKEIKVSVTKFPLNMTNVKAVTFCCKRMSNLSDLSDKSDMSDNTN